MPANKEVLEYIRNAAQKRGWDPDVFEKVSRAEALNVFDPSKPDLGGDEGSSFGPFQLHYKGMSKSMPNAGMGDDFTAATGLHASDPSTWPRQVDFVMDHFAKGGSWSPWMGAKAAGITGRMGIPGGSPGIAMGAPQGASGVVAPGTIMPPLDAPAVAASGGASAPAVDLGDKLGGAIFGDDLAASLKKTFGADAPANSTGKQGLGLLGSALGGGGSQQAAIDRENANIQPSAALAMDDSARIQAGTQLMQSLLAKKKTVRSTGLSMGV